MSDQHDQEAAQEHEAEMLATDTMQIIAVSDMLDALLPFEQENILMGCALFAADVFETPEEIDRFLDQFPRTVREFFEKKTPLVDDAI